MGRPASSNMLNGHDRESLCYVATLFLTDNFFSVIFPINFVCKWAKEILEQWVGYKGWGGVVTSYEMPQQLYVRVRNTLLNQK